MTRILIIKLGALGDFVQALAATQRIRQAHPAAEITLLTTPAYGELGRLCPWVDHVETDGRPRGLRAVAAMLRRLRRVRYDRIYDLQTSARTAFYHHALQPNPPEWSGVAAGASHPHRNPDRDAMHTLERQAEQLRDAGVWPDAPTGPGSAPPPDLSWLTAGPPPAIAPPQPYALLVPGGSAHRLAKRWPAASYAEVARRLVAQGLNIGVQTGPAEPGLAPEIIAAAGAGVDLSAASLVEIARMAAQAALCVGNDTGPTHLAAAAGAPTLTLFSAASDPALCAPRGLRSAVLRREPLSTLCVDEVLAAARALIADA